jgi:hypothetical protein
MGENPTQLGGRPGTVYHVNQRDSYVVVGFSTDCVKPLQGAAARLMDGLQEKGVIRFTSMTENLTKALGLGRSRSTGKRRDSTSCIAGC